MERRASNTVSSSFFMPKHCLAEERLLARKFHAQDGPPDCARQFSANVSRCPMICSLPTHAGHKDAIIYELHVKTFQDSTGDGMGDFRGLIGKLDYLQDLGVTAIWLLPFYPLPCAMMATTSRITTMLIRTMARWPISRRSSPRRTSAGCASSRSW